MAEKARGAMFRSKCRWYNEADKSSKYFLNLEKQRSSAKNMSALIKDGTIITDTSEILNEQEKFYANLYRSDETIRFECDESKIPKLTPEESESMEHEITLQELTYALKNSKRNCSPGADGLITSFYIIFWKKLGPLLVKACQCAFSKGKMFDSGLLGIIVMIPKRDRDSRFLKNLRPISLLNSDYKLIAKVLAERMKPKLLRIIHTDQTGFLKGRRSCANIRCVLDLIDYIDRQSEEGVILSVDYEKCFDRIERQSLLGAMKAFNFGPVMCKWTQVLYNGCHSRILNNGHLSERIMLTRGYKQGGAMQPILLSNLHRAFSY